MVARAGVCREYCGREVRGVATPAARPCRAQLQFKYVKRNPGGAVHVGERQRASPLGCTSAQLSGQSGRLQISRLATSPQMVYMYR